MKSLIDQYRDLIVERGGNPTEEFLGSLVFLNPSLANVDETVKPSVKKGLKEEKGYMITSFTDEGISTLEEQYGSRFKGCGIFGGMTTGKSTFIEKLCEDYPQVTPLDTDHIVWFTGEEFVTPDQMLYTEGAILALMALTNKGALVMTNRNFDHVLPVVDFAFIRTRNDDVYSYIHSRVSPWATEFSDLREAKWWSDMPTVENKPVLMGNKVVKALSRNEFISDYAEHIIIKMGLDHQAPATPPSGSVLGHDLDKVTRYTQAFNAALATDTELSKQWMKATTDEERKKVMSAYFERNVVIHE